jgi:hypothetical protein
MFLEYLNEFFDHWAQAKYLKDLVENLADLYGTFTQEEISGIKQ